MRGRPRTASVLAALAGSLLLVAGPAAAAPRPGQTLHVTATHDGSPPDVEDNFFGRGGEGVDISADGRFVAFASRIANLVPGADDNLTYDIFVRDLAAGVTERVSSAIGGGVPNGASHQPAISADGRFVAFDSDASNLHPGDTDTLVDIYVHDRETGETELVSVSSEGEKSDRNATNPAISADGRHVSFASAATNFGERASDLCQEIYVRDLAAGTTTRATAAHDGSPSRGVCTYLMGSAISADGSAVAFETQMHDLVERDLNASWDIFVRDMGAESTERVSVSSGGDESNYVSYNPSISPDGRFVSFTSCASNLVPEDNNSSGTKVTSATGSNTCFDIFVHDRETGATERISVSSDGDEADQRSEWADISADGRFVAFASAASTLGESGFRGRVFVRDRASGQTEFVSVGPGGEELDSVAWADPPAISADGRYVAFSAGAEIYVRDRGPHTGAFRLSTERQGEWVEASGLARFGGQVIAAATDPAGDGAADAVGGDLTGASVAYRPEAGDLLVRFDVTDLTTTSVSAAGSNYLIPGVAGAPGVLHTMAFTLNGTRHEVRAIRDNVEEPAYPPPPLIGLWRCNPGCSEIAHLDGAYGGTGRSIIAAIPLKTLGAAEGDALSGLAASVAIGHALGGEQERLDEVPLGDATIPERRLEIGIAAAGTPEDQVEFRAIALAGSFSELLPAAGLSDAQVWARACLGDVCRTEVVSA